MALLALAAGCAPGMRSARQTIDDPPTEREIEDGLTRGTTHCRPRLSLIFPGSTALCEGRTAEGAALVSLGAAELATTLAFGLKDGFTTPQATVPLFAFTDLWAADVLDQRLRTQRALRLRYVPPESLPELVAAPFSLGVLGEPAVWAGIVGTVGAGFLYSRLVDGPSSWDSSNLGQRPQLFGATRNTLPGYAAAGAIGVGLFTHVAVTEEMIFRGLVQSGFARRYGETEAWVLGSLVFGLFHSTNVLFLNSDARAHYLLTSVPFITVIGSYLGFVYQHDRYSASGPVAVHFWYDFLTEAIAFVLDPKNSPLAVSYGAAF